MAAIRVHDEDVLVGLSDSSEDDPPVRGEGGRLVEAAFEYAVWV
jgi:hypothetical protein